jgi:hypothetical protein
MNQAHRAFNSKKLEGEISVEYVPTNVQAADVLTRPLAREKHRRFVEGMGVSIASPELHFKLLDS